MKTTSVVATNQRLRGEPAWRLLAADNSPAVIGLLRVHLFEGERRLTSSILAERIGRDIVALRDGGVDLPEPAQTYLSQWLKSGFLERSYEPGSNEEVYELSAAGIQAIRYIDTLSQKRTVATESRLSLVIQQLTQLAAQTETDPESRVEHLLKERARLDAEIEAVRAGRVEAIPEDRALERAREIIALTDELANDFRQVRDQFSQLNRQLRERIVENEGSRGGVLEDLFAGVDEITASEAGRTFKAFWRLLTDPELSMELEYTLERLFSREFMQKLDRKERRFLSGMTRLLLERGGNVHDTLQYFARSLKQFVQSREYLEQRRLNQLLKEAQRLALDIKDCVKPTDQIGHTLNLTSSKLRSLSQFRFHDPSRDRVEAGIPLADTAEISLETVSELVAHSEINFRNLEECIRAILISRDQVAIAEILDVHPAEQGLGSVVGYLALGSSYGVKTPHKETVQWKGLDGVERRARIPRIYFLKGCFDETR